MRVALFLCLTLLWSSCAAPPQRIISPSVSRGECLAIAQAYVSHRWIPTAANVLHGPDPDGIHVDTPDISWRQPGAVPGWWVPGVVNTGIPYQWGGFATPAQFDRDVAAGRAAGDIYTAAKRRLLDAAVSRHATGIDCSGLISRCWKLPRSFSTRELPALCHPLESWDHLLPGDILNTWNSHVVLFSHWTTPARTTFIGIETGVPPHWLVVAHPVSVADLRQKGFTPWRFKGMRDN